MKTRHPALPLLALGFFLLAGCSPLVKADQTYTGVFVPLDRENNLGQTLVARYDGLQAVTLQLKPGSDRRGILVLNLRSSPQSDDNLATATLPLEMVVADGSYSLGFTPQKDSTQRYYYVLLKIRGPGDLQVGVSDDARRYLNGALYSNHTPLAAQMTFHLEYSLRMALTGLLKEGLKWAAWLGVSVYLFVIPGWALLSYLWPAWRSYHWAEKLGLAGGVSLAIYPLLFLWASLFGLKPGVLYAWVPPLLGIGALIWLHRKDYKGFPGRLRRRYSSLLHDPLPLLPELALLILIFLIILTRFWAVRGLEAGMWGDSYQHTMIAQLLVDNQGLFNSWQPYAEMTTFTYHFGFHSQVAVYHWLTRLPMHKAVLWMGQILNIMAVVFLFPLAMRLKRSVWSGVFALMVAGLLVQMPMYYVNWGRYTQLAGQAILPVMVCLAWVVLDSRETSWRQTLFTWILLGGLALTHYRVLVFAVLFFLAYLLMNLGSKSLSKKIPRMALSIFGAAALVLPWFIHLAAGRLPMIAANVIRETATRISSSGPVVDPVQNLEQFLPASIWLLLAVVLGWRLWSRDRAVATIGIWCFSIYLAANPHLVRLPGDTLIYNFTVMIAAYIPASIILGSAAGRLVGLAIRPFEWQEDFSRQKQRAMYKWVPVLLLIMVTIGSLWSARVRLWDVDAPAHAMLTRPDVRAFDWIRENIPSEATFLINSFPVYNNSAVVGADGSWWAPLLARRKNTVPPLQYVAEQGPFPGYHAWVVAPTIEVNAKGIGHPDVLRLLDERNITHVLIGQQQGAVNNAAVIDPFQLQADPHFEPIYHQDRVWIFMVSTP
jgi:hypothetical protein